SGPALPVGRAREPGTRQERDCALSRRRGQGRVAGVKAARSRAVADPSAVADYKRVLQQVLENRPAGTRLRLAEALGKNRSFISQIANPSYSVPITAGHIECIVDICHFLASEKAQFMAAYQHGNPDSARVDSGV